MSARKNGTIERSVSLLALCCALVAAARPCSAGDGSGGAREAGSSAGARGFFRLGSGGAEAELSVRRFGSSAVLSASGQRASADLVCLLCSERELSWTARELGERFVAASEKRETTRLRVAGAAPESELRIDGQTAMLRGGTLVLEPGEHELELRSEDGRSKGAVELREGELNEVELGQLEPSFSPATRQRLRIALAGLGVAAAAAGAALLAMDGSCASERRDADGDCARLHELRAGGWSLVGAGAAALVGAIAWWLLDRERDQRRDEGEVEP
ncbi:MAG: hypothetical protein R6V85_14790 [Polyangia bacterium]